MCTAISHHIRDRFGVSGIEIGSNINGVMLGESLT
jgi:hypothetical protein